jgi:hypothetical protein
MSAVCSQCSTLYAQGGRCPRCGDGVPTGLSASSVRSVPRWLQTPWGRVLIGLILSQGLFYGLRHLLTGILLAVTGAEPQDLWADMSHLVLLQAIQLLALFAGGMLAGGGQQQGVVLGLMAGIWNGVLSVLLRQNPAQEVTMVGLYGQPLLHAAFGTLGGWLGMQVWKPIPVASPILLAPQRKAPAPRTVSAFAGRIFWFRVLAGSAFAIAGTLSATMLFQKVLDASGGILGTSHELQDRLITWEIKAMAVLVGGALAGATTSNGFKQGFFVGLCSSVVLIGIQAPMTDVWFQLSAFTIISTFSLTLVGGWFGGQLFPPVVKIDRRGMHFFA